METPRIADAVRGLRHVFLRDLVLPARIGVHPHEHAAPQRVRINVDLAVEDEGARAASGEGLATLSRPPVGRDELSRVVDYEAVADAVRRIVAAGHVQPRRDPGGADRRGVPGRPAGGFVAGARRKTGYISRCHKCRGGGGAAPPLSFVHVWRGGASIALRCRPLDKTRPASNFV